MVTERMLDMIYTELTKKALRICFDAHKEQNDKTGMPYVFHPFHLAEQMTDEISTVCALLHEVVEDTEMTLGDLSDMGFPKEVIEVLELLTHEKDVPYFDYVERISKNPIAKKVKLADLAHNSDLTRFDGEKIDDYAIARNEKYKKAIEMLLK